MMKRSFLESPRFPIDVINKASAKEKSGGGRPPHWEMVFWWTRKPLASARAIIAGALLPEDVDPKLFIRALRLREDKVAHRLNPRLEILGEYANYIRGKSLLDPFAGFGSIPLEAIRLGLSLVVAVELLPTAYIFLKAVLEYPLKYGEKLVKDVERWGKWIVEQLRKDPQIRELYDEDVAVYIGTWEVKCPHCGKWTPLIGNWWLARVKKGNKYSRLAWMDYEKEDDEIKIRVIDLNRELNRREITAKIDTKKGTVEVEVIRGQKKIYRVRTPNIQARNETATCLHCGNSIRYVDPQTGRHYTEKPRSLRERAEWYVKHAIKKYNQGDKSLARQRILIRVKIIGGDLVFEPATQQDQQKLQKAEKYIQELLEKKDPDIPTEQIPIYENRSIWVVVYGFDRFCKLFNPRQLLTLVKIVKLIREAGHRIEQEKTQQGHTKEEAHKYAEAVATYLAIALIRFVDYNTLCTLWNYGGQLPAQVAHTLTNRGISMNWNWGDCNPSIHMSGTGTFISNLYKIFKTLRYLIAFNTKNFCEIFLDDATNLNLSNINKFSIIVTDPPYYDDVPYSELSDFYYVWLKRALCDVEGGCLVPRFHAGAFFRRVGAGYREIRTQWEEFADKEISLNANRSLFGGDKEKAKKFFLDGLKRSFMRMSELLSESGVLTTYYAHTNPEAWEALLEAGWKGGKMKVTNALPLVTESAQRLTARGKAALDVSIVVVWRKGISGRALVGDVYNSAVEAGADWTMRLLENNYRGINLFYGVMGRVLEVFTSYEDIVGPSGSIDVSDLVNDYIYPATVDSIVRGLSRYIGSGEAGSRVSSSEGMFYLIAKVLFWGSSGSKRVLDRSSFSILVIGTRVDKDKIIKTYRIVEKKDSKFYLAEPTSTNPDDLFRLLKQRRIDPNNPRVGSSVDVLHLLEYWVVRYPSSVFLEKYEALRSAYPAFVEEAISMAEVFNKLLQDGDPEKVLCRRILMVIRGGVLG